MSVSRSECAAALQMRKNEYLWRNKIQTFGTFHSLTEEDTRLCILKVRKKFIVVMKKKHTHTHTHTPTHARTHARMHPHTHTHSHAHTHTYTHTHAHIQAHIQPWKTAELGSGKSIGPIICKYIRKKEFLYHLKLRHVFHFFVFPSTMRQRMFFSRNFRLRGIGADMMHLKPRKAGANK